MTYDSRIDTYEHIAEVRARLHRMAKALLDRGEVHDRSKLVSPEREVFDEVTPRLRAMTYGSDEYKASLAEMGSALAHHYEANSHHPEHFTGSSCLQCGNDESDPSTCGGPRVSLAGISGMTLLDLVEMLCDWDAATKRHADGDILRSIEVNQKRFGYSDELKQILLNTVGREFC